MALVNEREALRAMYMFFEPLLRDAGIPGRVFVDLALEADGSVRAARMVRSTHDSFADSAQRVARMPRFTRRAEPGTAVRVRMDGVHPPQRRDRGGGVVIPIRMAR